MNSLNPYPDTELPFTGGSGFCWEFDEDYEECFLEDGYAEFLVSVYDYNVLLYEPYFR